MSIEYEPTIAAVHEMLARRTEPDSLEYRTALGEWVVAKDANEPAIISLEELTIGASLELDDTSIYFDGQLVLDPELVRRLVTQITRNFGLPSPAIHEN